MSTEAKADFLEPLYQLSERIAEIIADGVLQRLLIPTKETYVRDRIEEAEETEYGAVRKKWELEYINKESWGNAARIVARRAKELEAHKLAHESLRTSHLFEEQALSLLERFTHRLAYAYLETQDDSKRQEYLNALLSLVTTHVNGEKLKYSSEVKLKGVGPPGSGIKLNISETEFHLRRVTVADLAKEQYHTGYREPFPDDPSAILSIQFLSTGPYEIQRKVAQAISVLRLFKVGSVRYLSYTMDSESLLDPFAGSIHSSGKHQVGYEQYIIDEADVPKLESFWQELSKVLPAGGLGQSTTDVEPIGIAYQRYSDALLTFGTVERRIAESVMGLESLFLRGSENQELTYRLRMRVAKVLGLLGANPYLAKRVANDAYTIRSAFVHGDIVPEKDKRDIEKRHTSLPSLLKSVLNQLRVAINLFLMSGQGKDELINLIDNSFIDQDKLPELERLLAPVKAFICFK